MRIKLLQKQFEASKSRKEKKEMIKYSKSKKNNDQNRWVELKTTGEVVKIIKKRWKSLAKTVAMIKIMAKIRRHHFWLMKLEVNDFKPK